MDFYAVLDQVVVLLQQRGRLTYGALKRQFQLDDEYLADLTAELIDGQRVAVDEGGKVLVWTGEGAPASAATRTPPQLQSPATYTPPHLAERIVPHGIAGRAWVPSPWTGERQGEGE